MRAGRQSLALSRRSGLAVVDLLRRVAGRLSAERRTLREDRIAAAFQRAGADDPAGARAARSRCGASPPASAPMRRAASTRSPISPRPAAIRRRWKPIASSAMRRRQIAAKLLPAAQGSKLTASYADRASSVSLFALTLGLSRKPDEIGLASYSTQLLPDWMTSLADYAKGTALFADEPGSANAADVDRQLLGHRLRACRPRPTSSRWSAPTA